MATDNCGVINNYGAIVTDPIEMNALRARVMDETRGAVTSFEGVVRNHDRDKHVTALAYTAHPTASQILQNVIDVIGATFPSIRCAVEHRVGALTIGDVALGVVVVSAHRGEAFAAVEMLVNQVKHEVPIWKNQEFIDGTSEWVGALE